MTHHRLAYRGKPYGPRFDSHDDAVAFAKWVANRTGLAPEHQPENVLERMRREFDVERWGTPRKRQTK